MASSFQVWTTNPDVPAPGSHWGLAAVVNRTSPEKMKVR